MSDGNVDLLVTQVLKGSSSRGAETIKVHLNDLNIKPCQSCGVDPYPEYCLYNDDMKLIYEALETCDVVVLGSPVYFDTVSAQTKLMIDRCNCLMPFVKSSYGTPEFKRRIEKRKKGIFIAVAGTDQEYDTILATASGFFWWANIELTEKILYSHDTIEIGGVRDNKEIMTRTYEIGVRLARECMDEKRT